VDQYDCKSEFSIEFGETLITNSGKLWNSANVGYMKNSIYGLVCIIDNTTVAELPDNNWWRTRMSNFSKIYNTAHEIQERIHLCPHVNYLSLCYG
jgi:hypothetical protein